MCVIKGHRLLSSMTAFKTFDIFYLFVPKSKRSEVQNQSWSEVFGDLKFKGIKLSGVPEEVMSFKILDM